MRALRPVSRTHVAVATVFEPTPTGAVQRLSHLPPGTDIAEIRCDAFWSDVPGDDAGDAVADLLEASPVPLLACLRPTRQGGRYKGREDVRLALLAAMAEAGFAYVDVELDVAQTPGLRQAIEQHGARMVVSHHFPADIPCRDDVRHAMMALTDAGDVQKIAFGTTSFVDVIRTLELVHGQRQAGATTWTSPLGGPAERRALLAVAGNPATYGHAGSPAAPGQPGLADVEQVWKQWGLTSEELGQSAGWYAVLGDPVTNSLSPRMHNAALRAAGAPERYGALQVPASSGALRLVFHAAHRMGLRGASVTFPHKTEAAKLAVCDEVAQALGAANQIRFLADKAEATNTDATALDRLLRPHVARGDSAIVLGAGGAARAAVWALVRAGAHVRVASRDVSRSRAALDLGADHLPWTTLGAARADVWIQATTLGLKDASQRAPDPQGARLAVELNYKAGATAFQTSARDQGATVVDGRMIVLEQAVDAYRFWFGREPDRRAMQDAVTG